MESKAVQVEKKVRELVALEKVITKELLATDKEKLFSLFKQFKKQLLFRGKRSNCKYHSDEAILDAITSYGLDGFIVRKILKSFGHLDDLQRIKDLQSEIFRVMQGYIDYLLSKRNIFAELSRVEYVSYLQQLFIRCLDRYLPKDDTNFVSYFTHAAYTALSKIVHFEHTLVHISKAEYHRVAQENPDELPVLTLIDAPVSDDARQKISDLLIDENENVEESVIKRLDWQKVAYLKQALKTDDPAVLKRWLK